MDITTTLIIGTIGIAIYIVFLILGFSLKGKNFNAQNIKEKK